MSGIPVSQQNALTESLNAIGREANPKILIVSGDADFRTGLQARLGCSRWDIEEAQSGADALRKLSQCEFHVLMLEPVLPDLTVGDFREILDSL